MGRAKEQDHLGEEDDMSPKKDFVHYDGLRSLRDGVSYGACGAPTETRSAGKVADSTMNVPEVTCPGCREHVARVGRAYSRARREKRIEW